MVELKLHNVQFYEYSPEAIQCMAYNDKRKCLALCRSGGTIELWNCTHSPFKEYELIGLHDEEIRGLAWCKDRLFSAGFGLFIYEYDLEKQSIAREVSVNGGVTWCLAASPDQKYLAAGTEAGTICIYELSSLNLVYKTSSRVHTERLLSIAWHADSDHVVAGATGCVHLWSMTKGRVFEFKVGASLGTKETIVWCIAILEDLTIVTGDSSGKISFWEGTFGTLISDIMTHEADILCLLCPDQKSIWAAGVDPMIVKVEKINKGWIKTVIRRHHSHDINAMALSEDGHLYSGGNDTKVVQSSYPVCVNEYTSMPPKGYISTARKARSILLGYKTKVVLWRLGSCDPSSQSGIQFPAIHEDHVNIAELRLRKGSMLKYCAVSPNAKWISYISTEGLELFGVSQPKDGKPGTIRKIPSIPKEFLPSLLIIWLDNDRLLSASNCGTLQTLRVKQWSVTIESEWKVTESSIRMISVSDDAKYVAVSDSIYRIVVRNLLTSSSVFVPKSFRIPTSLSFDSDAGEIIITSSDPSISEFDYLNSKYTQFHNKFHSSAHAVNMENRAHSVHNAVYHPDTNMVLMNDESAIIVLNKSTGVESQNEDVGHKRLAKKRKKINSTKQNGHNALSSSFRLTYIERKHIVLYFEYLQNGDAVCIELDPVKLADNLPLLLDKKRFGV